MRVILKSQYRTHYAEGNYDGKGVTVLKGSKINTNDTFPKMSLEIKNYRHNPEYVNEQGIVIKDVYFSSPSAAAIFVTGRSSNGYIAWRIDDKISLKEFRTQEKV